MADVLRMEVGDSAKNLVELKLCHVLVESLAVEVAETLARVNRNVSC